MASDRRLGIFFICAGVIALFVIPAQSPTSPEGTSGVPSYLFPLIAVFAVVIAGVVLTIRSKKALNPDASSKPILMAFGGLAGTLLYFMVACYLGYIVTTFTALIIYFRFLTKLTWVRSILLAVLFTGFVYMMFEKGFRIRLPEGILF